ncbi:Thiolase N-terminal domain-containing protein [Acinetobacter pragensis]|uniref:Thiolase N-terminal domain-containing protein n=1 Tax=Acinetobacter pragensis TaxID=1806892 RepID=A0A151Y428_9GAMM|nr:hypothetical protein AZH43_07670 [Acinetobacter pragensis]
MVNEIIHVVIPQRKGNRIVVDTDEHPCTSTSLEGLNKLKAVVKTDGLVTAGNASGINDGVAVLLIAFDKAFITTELAVTRDLALAMIKASESE